MDNLRWILLLSGILLIVGIFTWEVFRRRHPEWDQSDDEADRSFETEGDGLFAEPANDRQTSGIGADDAARLASPGAGDGKVSGEPSRSSTRSSATIAPPPEKPAPGETVQSSDGPEAQQQGEEPLICAIAVMAKPGHRFSGGRICEALEAEGMRYGQMGIFHYYGPEEQSHDRSVFSAANMLEPGSFDLQALDSLYTPGLMLFMQLPAAMDGTEVFDRMLATGKALAERLGGELRDETRSSLTPQSISHMRERIIDFGRRRRLNVR